MNQGLLVVSSNHVLADALWNRVAVTFSLMITDDDKTGARCLSHAFRILLDFLRLQLLQTLLNHPGQGNRLGNVECSTSYVFVENARDNLVPDKAGCAHQQNQKAHHQQKHSGSQRTRQHLLDAQG